jgi:choline dehydrogenase-like flavoprotein
MSFNSSTYINFVSAASAAQERLFLQYLGHRSDFDIIIIGSGIGGGVLADDLAERLGKQKRILVLEAGSFLYPTHVYNVCRFPNASLAKHFGCGTFWQSGNGAMPNDNNGASRVDIKFSFSNCLDNTNEVLAAPPFGYVPQVNFRNLKWMDHLAQSRFPAVAGWQKSYDDIFAVLNQVTYQIFSQFQQDGHEARPLNESWYGMDGKGFGWGTVHHAAGSLRMPHRPRYNGPIESQSVVDEDLRVVGTPHLYVCDMSVMPFSSAANPVRTLALALRLSIILDSEFHEAAVVRYSK